MNFIDIIQNRFSVRNYTDTQVETEKLDQILEAGRIAPTAANKQPQHLIVIQSEEGLKKLAKACNPFNASTAIIVCSDTRAVWKRPQDGKLMTDVDATIVTDHLMHRATELGLGTLWMTWFDLALLKAEFNIPEHVEPVNILLIGYSNEPEKSKNRFNTERKGISSMVTYESF
jgi:nitroreductase